MCVECGTLASLHRATHEWNGFDRVSLKRPIFLPGIALGHRVLTKAKKGAPTVLQAAAVHSFGSERVRRTFVVEPGGYGSAGDKKGTNNYGQSPRRWILLEY
jgi:hypothetical protein